MIPTQKDTNMHLTHEQCCEVMRILQVITEAKLPLRTRYEMAELLQMTYLITDKKEFIKL